MAEAIISLNSGSSSVKFSLYRIVETGVERTGQLALQGMVDGIGTCPIFEAKIPGGKKIINHDWRNATQEQAKLSHADLLDDVLNTISDFLEKDQLIAIGHRVVHGGSKYIKPVIIDDTVLSYLESITPFAPLHQPGSLASVRAMKEARPDLLQVACFDTSFHHTIPAYARNYALPRRYADAGIHKYGFHGLSYEYISSRLKDAYPTLWDGKTIAAHLGNGASLAALSRGISVETTMGFSALDGLMMGTRTGSIDPGVLLYMLDVEKLTSRDISTLLYRQSGLLGSSGASNDLRELHQIVTSGSQGYTQVQEALDMFVYKVATFIAAMGSALGGIDGLIFTAGIGENDQIIREQVCNRLTWLGIQLDKKMNTHRGECRISSDKSKIEVHVIPTNEEIVILKHVMEKYYNC